MQGTNITHTDVAQGHSSYFMQGPLEEVDNSPPVAVLEALSRTHEDSLFSIAPYTNTPKT